MVWRVNVCVYNVMLPVAAPIRFNGQDERANRIPEAIQRLSSTVPDLDVVVFIELISPPTRKIILEAMSKLGWIYVSDILSSGMFSSSLKLVNGGIVVMSRYPIIFQYNYIFEHLCEGYDCSACKGVVFCRIQKGNNIFNILCTHLQAWDTPVAKQIRKEQILDCQKVLESIGIPLDEPVIIAGDFNIDFYTRQTEIDILTDILRMTICDKKAGSPDFTSDPSINQLMGNDEDSKYATDFYPKGCYAEYVRTMRCPCCPQEWLDYIGFSNVHLAPATSVMYAYVLKADTPFLAHINITTERNISDLSDHFPVIGKFIFNEDTPFCRRLIQAPHLAQNIISIRWILLYTLLIILFLILLCAIYVLRYRK